MDPNHLLKRVKENGITEYVHVIEYFDSLKEASPNSGVTVDLGSFSTRCLRYACQDLKESKGISEDNISKLLKLTTRCFDQYYASLISNKVDKTETVVERALYHLVYDLVRLGEHKRSLQVGHQLHKLLLVKLSPLSKLSKELLSVVNGTYLSLWNSALAVKEPKYATTDIPTLSLRLRLQAIKFLLFNKSPESENIQRLAMKILPSIQAYTFSVSQNGEFKEPHMDLNDFFSELLPLFYQWVNDMLQNTNVDLGSIYRLFVEVQQNHFKYLKRMDCPDEAFTDVVKVWLGGSYFDERKLLSRSILDFVHQSKPWSVFEFVDFCQGLGNKFDDSFEFPKLIHLTCLNCAMFYLRSSSMVLRSFETPEKSHSYEKYQSSVIKFVNEYVTEVRSLSNSIKNSESFQEFFESIALDSHMFNLRQTRLAITSDSTSNPELIDNLSSICNYCFNLQIRDAKILEQIEKELGKSANICAQAKNYSTGANLYSWTCVFCVQRLQLTSNNETDTLAQYLQVLSTCQRKAGELLPALQTLYICMCVNQNSALDCFEKWAKVKESPEISGMNLKSMTIKDIREDIHHGGSCSEPLSKIMSSIPKKVFNDVVILDLLDLELDVIKKKEYDSSSECNAVILHILSLAGKTSVIRAKALLHLFQTQIHENEKASSSNSKHFTEATRILKYLERKRKNMHHVKYHLALAYFWQYVKKVDSASSAMEEEIKVSNIKPLDQVEENQSPTQQDGINDENDTCDVIPAYAGISVEAEIELTKDSLDIALENCWEIGQNTELVEQLSIAQKENFVHTLKAMSEIYNSYKRVTDEVKCLSVAAIICSKANLTKDWIFFNSVLIRRLCHCHQLTKASTLYNITKNIVDDNFDKESIINSSCTRIAHFTFSLAEAEYLFHSGSESISTYVRNILDHPIMSMNSRSSLLLQSEAYLFLSDVFLAQPKCLQQNEDIGKNTNSVPIFLKIRSVECAIWTMKDMLMESSYSIEDSIYRQRKALNNATDSCLSLGKLFLDIGAIREARSFLKEGLKISQSMPLAIRTVEGLAAMIETDLMCSTLADCQVKLAGIFYILTKSPKGTNNCKSDLGATPDSEDEDFLMKKSGRQTNTPFILRDKTESGIMASPTLRKSTSKNIILPKFVNHSTNCSCVRCSYLHLQIQLMTYISLAGDTLQLEADFGQAFQMYLLVEKLSFQFSGRLHKEFHQFCSGPLNKINEKTKGFSTNVGVVRCHTGVKAADLMIQLKKGKECIAYAQRTLNILMNFPKYVTAQFPILVAKLCYLLCVASLQSLASSKLCLFTEVYNDKWNCLAPSYLPPITKTSIHDGIFKTPTRDDGPKDDLSCLKEVNNKEVKKKVGNRGRQLKPSRLDLGIEQNFQDNVFKMPTADAELMIETSGRSTKVNKEKETTNIKNAPRRKKPPRRDHLSNQNGDVQITKDLSLGSEPHRDNVKTVVSSADNQQFKMKNGTVVVKSKRTTRSKINKCIDELSTNATTKRSSKTNCIEIMRSDDGLADEVFKFCLDDVPKNESKQHVGVKRADSIEKLCSDSPFCNEALYTPIPTRNRPRKGLILKNGNNTKSQTNDKICDMFKDTLSRPDHDIQDFEEKDIYRPVKTESNAVYALKDIKSKLLEAKTLLDNFPPSTLYKDMCVLLALMSGNTNKDASISTSSYLCDGTAIVLRHLAISTILRKLGRHIHKGPSAIQNGVSDPHCRNSGLTNEEVFQTQNGQLGVLNFNDSANISELLSRIPQGWTVVQVNSLHPLEKLNNSTICPSELFISRYRKNECCTVRAAIKRSEFCFDVDDENAANIFSEFDRILSGAKLTLKNYTTSAEWWKNRRSNDNDMKAVIKAFEEKWLKHWRGMFLGKPSHVEDLNHLNHAVKDCKSALEKLNVFVDCAPLDTIIDSAHILPEEQLIDAICCLAQLQPTHPDFRKIRSCVEHYSKILNSDLFEREHVILILGKDVQHIPWEGTEILKRSPVCRMPSMRFLISHLSLLEAQPDVFGKKVDTESVFYVLNPSGDLAYTEEYFTEPFEQMDWKGIIRQPPTAEQFQAGLIEEDLFIYCGHGSGGMYLAGENIRKLNCNAAVFLVGCSSGLLKCLGPKLEPVGAIHHYLLSGCTSILGMLWEVTDKDVDSFLDDLLKRWLPRWRNKSNESDLEINYITSHISLARNVCKMKYLTGCSCVVYGLPIYRS